MRKTIYLFAFIAFTILLSQAAFADVKIKSKQSMSGQTYENTTYIKGKRQRTETMSGAMINITQCDLHRGIQVNPQSKTYLVNPFATTTQTVTTPASSKSASGVVTAGGKITTTITTKDTGERKQMFGFTAKHLIITMESVSSPDACNKNNMKMVTDGWYIDAEFALDCDQTYASYTHNNNVKPGGCQDKYDVKQIGTAKRGYPVYEKMTMFDENGKENYSMVNEVTELSKATLEPALFDVPEGYREVSDASQMYAAASYSSSSSSTYSGSASSAASNSGLAQNIQNRVQPADAPASSAPGPKKPGVVRIGLASVKTGAVGEGITAADLAAAVGNSLNEYLKGPKIEVVGLDARLTSSIESEAREKECDYIVYTTVSHKKGGGGFGMFGAALGSAIAQTGIGHTGSVAGNIAGQVATQAIVSATTVSSNVKTKDEISLDVKLQQPGGAAVLSKVVKAKARSNGDDIISQVVEQAAQAVTDTVGR
jgi:hypothetical protein